MRGRSSGAGHPPYIVYLIEICIVHQYVNLYPYRRHDEWIPPLKMSCTGPGEGTLHAMHPDLCKELLYSSSYVASTSASSSSGTCRYGARGANRSSRKGTFLTTNAQLA